MKPDPESNPPTGPYGLPVPSHPLLSGKVPIPPLELLRGNKDPYIAMCMPSAYADACAKAKQEGTLAELLNQVADELSGDLGDNESTTQDWFTNPDLRRNLLRGNHPTQIDSRDATDQCILEIDQQA